MSVFQGGKFGHGFASVGVTQAFAGSIDGIDEGQRFSPKRIVAAAVIGGTSSSITGGKFSNGAVTGVFSRAFNDEAHLSLQLKKPKFFGYINKALEWALGTDASVVGVSASIVWSSPNREGEGEYDLGFGLTFDIDEFGVSTGRAAIAYGESWRSDVSVKDFAGINGAISLDLGKAGVTASESG